MSVSVLIEAVAAEGFCGGGVVAPAFGGCAGSLASLTAAMTAARMVAMLAGPLPVRLVEASSPNAVSLMVVCLDGPVLADQAGQVLRGGVRVGEAGDGVDGLARGLAGGGLLPPAGGRQGHHGTVEVQGFQELGEVAGLVVL
jgi:hypothetical protein